jgi:hypothetical protein
MIEKEEDWTTKEISRLLYCDCCKHEFDGGGLPTNALVRAAAKALDGYGLRRFDFWSDAEDTVKTVRLDLCAACLAGSIDVIKWRLMVGPALIKAFGGTSDEQSP